MNLRTRLLNRGLEIIGTYEQVKVWIEEVEQFEGRLAFTYSEVVKHTLDLEGFNELKVIDLRGTFIDTKAKVAVGISDREVFLDTGDKKQLIELLESVKTPETTHDINVGDIVQIQGHKSGRLILSSGRVCLDTNFTYRFGIVKRCNDYSKTFTIAFGSTSFDFPRYCIVPANNVLLNKEMLAIHKHLYGKCNNIDFGKDYNYMSLTEDGSFIEYIDTKRLSRFKGDFWNEELRAKFAVKKKIRGVLGSIYADITDSLMSEVIMLYASNDIDVEILLPSEIYSIFEDGAVVNQGSIGGSCMKGKSSDRFKIYEDSIDGVAVMRDDSGKIILRALLWKLTHAKSGETMMFMDRIYSSNTSFETKLKGWAIQNGYHYLEEQTYDKTEALSPEGKKVSLRGFYAETAEIHYDSVPYIDTMCVFAGGRLFCYGSAHRAKSTGGEWYSSI